MMMKYFSLKEYSSIIFTTELEMSQKWDADRHMEDSELAENLKNIIKSQSNFDGIKKLR